MQASVSAHHQRLGWRPERAACRTALIARWRSRIAAAADAAAPGDVDAAARAGGRSPSRHDRSEQQQEQQQRQHQQRGPRPHSGGGSGRSVVARASNWRHLVGPASDLSAMSDPDRLGQLLVRALQLAPASARGAASAAAAPPRDSRREAEDYSAFVSHALELSARLMRNVARGSSDDDDGGGGGSVGGSSTSAAGGFQPWQVAGVAYNLAAAGVQPGQRWERALLASVLPQLRAGIWSARDLSKLAFALARLRVSTPPAWQASFLDAWTSASAGQAADGRQLSSMLWAAGKLGWRASPAHLAHLRASAADLLPSCADRDVVWLVWGLTALHGRAVAGMGGGGSSSSSNSSSGNSGSSGSKSDPQHTARHSTPSRPDAPLELILQRAVERALPSMRPQGLAMVADALALASGQTARSSGLGDFSGAARRQGGAATAAATGEGAAAGAAWQGSLLAKVVARADDKLSDFRFDELASLLDALARLRAASTLSPAWADAVAARLVSQVPLCQAEGVASALWALGTLGWRGQRGAVSRLLWRSEQLLGDMAPRDLARLATGLVRLGERPPPVWLSNFMSAFEALMPLAAPRDLSTAAWALARLKVRPARGGGAWTEALVAAAGAPSLVGRFSAQDMERLVFALGAWRHCPSDARAWAAVQGRLRAVLPQADARSVAVVAHALGRIRHRRPRRSATHDGGESDDDSDDGVGGGGGGGDVADENAVANADAAGRPTVVESATLEALVARTGQLLSSCAAAAAAAGASAAGDRQEGSLRPPAFTAEELANIGRGLALLGARPDQRWLEAWHRSVDVLDATFDPRTRAAAQWATSALEDTSAVGA